MLVGIAVHLKGPDDPLKLLALGWMLVAALSTINCGVPAWLKSYVLNVANYVKSTDFFHGALRIFVHNLVVLLLCYILGKGYYGFVAANTALVSASLSRGYPFGVVFGGHTLLELYSYSLATTRRKRDLVKAVAYLALAAAFEETAIRF